MTHPVNWFQIQGRDGKGLQAFYKQVFGWQMDPGPDGMSMVKGEAGGMSGGIGASMSGASSVAVYVGVPNLEAQLGKIKKAGGKQAMPPMELPQGMGRIAGFTDPGGNWIGLWQAGKAMTAPTKAPAKKASAKKASAKKAARKAPPRKASKAKPAKRAAKRRGHK